mgnify:FL=1
MKRKPRASTVLVVLLLVAGLCVVLYPTASDLFYRWQAEQEIEQYNQVTEAAPEDYSELWEAAEAYNRQLAEQGATLFGISTQEEEEVFHLLNPLGTGMMGYIDIPAIDVYLPIYQGTGERALQSGAGYWLGPSLPTGGESTHCVLTAHNGLVKAKMFTDLDKLKLGDRFSLQILDRTLTYQVDQILVTVPEDTSALQIVEGKDYVTLYTCTPYGINTHRLLVRGVRVDDQETEGESLSRIPAQGNGALYISFFVLPLLALRGLRVYWQHRKQKKVKEGGSHEEN